MSQHISDHMAQLAELVCQMEPVSASASPVSRAAWEACAQDAKTLMEHLPRLFGEFKANTVSGEDGVEDDAEDERHVVRVHVSLKYLYVTMS